ncbi:hypothetical protein FACS189485_07160 [Spirochaetia bacterium]|nr:hypothetical protein FACS189485_07160 [Spirochaetia bacterium]
MFTVEQQGLNFVLFIPQDPHLIVEGRPVHKPATSRYTEGLPFPQKRFRAGIAFPHPSPAPGLAL